MRYCETAMRCPGCVVGTLQGDTVKAVQRAVADVMNDALAEELPDMTPAGIADLLDRSGNFVNLEPGQRVSAFEAVAVTVGRIAGGKCAAANVPLA